MKPIKGNTYFIVYNNFDYDSYSGLAVCVDDVKDVDDWYKFLLPDDRTAFFCEEDILGKADLNV